jgi:tetratricopeptide (TPR) repeat protein
MMIRALAAILFTLGSLANSALAEPSEAHPDRVSDWPIDDADPEVSVPSNEQRDRNPIEFGYWIQDVAAKATRASQNGDHATAVKYFRAMLKAVPDRAVAASRLCAEYQALGQAEQALAACHDALQLEGVTLNDYLSYVRLALAPPKLTSERRAEVQAVLDHLREQGAAGSDVLDEIDCELALKTEDVPRLERCVGALRASANARPTTILYQWTLAMKQGHLDDAKRALEHARVTSMNAEAVSRMERETSKLAMQRGVVLALRCTAVLSAAVVLAFALLSLQKRRTSLAR